MENLGFFVNGLAKETTPLRPHRAPALRGDGAVKVEPDRVQERVRDSDPVTVPTTLAVRWLLLLPKCVRRNRKIERLIEPLAPREH